MYICMITFSSIEFYLCSKIVEHRQQRWVYKLLEVGHICVSQLFFNVRMCESM